jgi:hypothetical protein
LKDCNLLAARGKHPASRRSIPWMKCLNVISMAYRLRLKLQMLDNSLTGSNVYIL